MSRGRSGQGDQFNSPQAAHFGHPFVCPRLLPSNALLLAAPGPQDSAQFECVVNNEVGESRRHYQVTVLGESWQRREVWAQHPPSGSPPGSHFLPV